MIQDIFLKTIAQYGLLKKRDKLMVGVSGGPDSMCLLHLLTGIQERYKLQLTAVHFNHALRVESDREECFVREYCQSLRIRCITDKQAIRREDVDSLEQTARLYRFSFFLRQAKSLHIKKLALAHTQDDLAETVLMRILRGSGLLGISSFGARSRYKSMTILRPLIGVGKKDILQYLKKNQVPYCIDQSNDEERFLRNRIRKTLMPYLEKEYNPSIKDVLVTLAKTAGTDYDFLLQQARVRYQKLFRRERSRLVTGRIEVLLQEHSSMQYLVLRLAIEEVKGSLRSIEYKHLEDILRLLESESEVSSLDIPGVVVEKHKGILYLKGVNLLDFKRE